MKKRRTREQVIEQMKSQWWNEIEIKNYFDFQKTKNAQYKKKEDVEKEKHSDDIKYIKEKIKNSDYTFLRPSTDWMWFWLKKKNDWNYFLRWSEKETTLTIFLQ